MGYGFIADHMKHTSQQLQAAHDRQGQKGGPHVQRPERENLGPAPVARTTEGKTALSGFGVPKPRSRPRWSILPHRGSPPPSQAMLRSKRITSALRSVVGDGITSALLLTLDGELLGSYTLPPPGLSSSSSLYHQSHAQQECRIVGALVTALANDYRSAGSDVLSGQTLEYGDLSSPSESQSPSDQSVSSVGGVAKPSSGKALSLALASGLLAPRYPAEAGPFKLLIASLADGQGVYAAAYCDCGAGRLRHSSEKGGAGNSGKPGGAMMDAGKAGGSATAAGGTMTGGADSEGGDKGGAGGAGTGGDAAGQLGSMSLDGEGDGDNKDGKAEGGEGGAMPRGGDGGELDLGAGGGGGAQSALGGVGGYYVVVVGKEDVMLGMLKQRLEALAGYVEESLSLL